MSEFTLRPMNLNYMASVPIDCQGGHARGRQFDFARLHHFQIGPKHPSETQLDIKL